MLAFNKKPAKVLESSSSSSSSGYPPGLVSCSDDEPPGLVVSSSSDDYPPDLASSSSDDYQPGLVVLGPGEEEEDEGNGGSDLVECFNSTEMSQFRPGHSHGRIDLAWSHSPAGEWDR